MNGKGLKDMEQDTREKGMTQQENFLKGVVPVETLFSEEFSDNTFKELEEVVSEKDGEASADLANDRKRMELIYAMSILRDAKYSHAARKFMMALGNNDTFRLLYEGAKLHIDVLNSK